MSEAVSHALSQQIAYEVDDISRIITVVYIGALTDFDVLGFYRGLLGNRPDAPDYDFLLDMRYTDWSARLETIAEIDALFNDGNRMDARRIAVVRKEHAVMYERDSALKRHGIGRRHVQYFATLETGRNWLSGRQSA